MQRITIRKARAVSGRRRPTSSRRALAVCLLLATITALPALATKSAIPRYPDKSMQQVPRQVRGETALDKLDSELQTLFEQLTAGRDGPEGRSYSAAQLQHLFGIAADEQHPTIQVKIRLAAGGEPAELAGKVVAVHSRHEQHVLATVVAEGLERLARLDAVEHVDMLPAAHTPQRPARSKAKLSPAKQAVRGDEFDKQGLSGEGVIVGVIDSGIDWRHDDFRNADGSTRILALWDITDSTWEDSNGEIGNEPPIGLEFMDLEAGFFVGTLYTADDINRALEWEGTVNSEDRFGHGTACASTAAGNGRATDGDIPVGFWAGIAPNADLLIAKAGDGVFPDYYVNAAQWMIETARELGRPCVINLSLGGHYGAHDGHEATEQVLDQLVGPGIPGVAICASAGNEGRESFHAAARFGPRIEGQADIDSDEIELFVKTHTELHVYFDADDEWGLGIVGLDEYLVDDYGNQAAAYCQKVDGVTDVLLSTNISLEEYTGWALSVEFSNEGSGQERVAVPLPPGRYVAWLYGATSNVTTGYGDLYFPFTFQASFGSGTVKTCMVGSPGNGDDLITVGSYDFRSTWPNADGGSTNYNLDLGGISNYSSPGFRIDGVVKPDLAAPGRYTVSAMAVGSDMAEGAGTTHVTSDGYHLAWDGTSASTPYVAGVVALMFEKNPNLDAAQIREILTRTATSDRQTGGTPNYSWGHGKVNPGAALLATPEP